MSQPNFQVDGLRVEPGSGQTLTISRDAATGSLRFVDEVIPGGINLSDLAGLGTIVGVFVVGTAGSGAGYTAIQDAIDAVSAAASPSSPALILVMPGVYSENLVIEKSGITVQGLGRVEVRAAGSSPTVTVRSSVSTYPTALTLRDLTLSQPNPGLACVSLVGGAGSTIGSVGVAMEGCVFAASGVGCYTVLADAVNYVSLRGCRSDGSSGSASMRVSQCAGLTVSSSSLPAVQVDYSSSGTIPSVVGSSYVFSSCPTVGNLQSTLSGAGSLSVRWCGTGNVTVSGNRTFSASGSTFGNVVLNGSTAAVLASCTRGTVSGSGTLSETQASGQVAFSGSTSESVSFPVARPNATYTVVIDAGDPTPACISSKSASGFDVVFSSPVTTTVYWTVLS